MEAGSIPPSLVAKFVHQTGIEDSHSNSQRHILDMVRMRLPLGVTDVPA